MVVHTSKGLHLALYLIKVVDTRFECADVTGMQMIGKILSENVESKNHIYLVFT